MRKVRHINIYRQIGYRILPGDTFSYILHMRPAEWPIMATHSMLGYVLAIGMADVLKAFSLLPALWALFIWVIFLNGSALAINSVFDKDEGDIGYLKAPPKPPRHLFKFSLCLMVIGFVLAITLPRGFRVSYAFCSVLSILYSVPPFRLKAVAGMDWIINMWGFGTISPYAIFAATGEPLDLISATVLIGFCPLFASLYPLTQLYQIEEDRRRGDRTLAIVLGIKKSLQVSGITMLIAFACFLCAWYLKFNGYLLYSVFSLMAILAVLTIWIITLYPWLRKHDQMSSSQHQKGMYRAFAVWAATDVVIVIAFSI